ncbi:MAG: hypothetical protein IJO88_01080 [Oscillospiraceae bacterium]|nr:hypothetical protein [Oscillospiraceae bacterium]
MYCSNCGVKLADSELVCPLCQTRAYHPDLPEQTGAGLYPKNKQPKKPRRSPWPQMILTAMFLLAGLIVLLCDLQVSGRVNWSGFVLGALAIGYVVFALPVWFRRPDPVIFVPCSFAAAGLYLLYISLCTKGGWFLSFALPVTAVIGLIVTAVTVLLKYVKKGRLYIFGGALIALGAAMLLIEALIVLTFGVGHFALWSLYPMTALVLVGCLLIFLAICRPARETMERKLFI